MTGQTFSWLTPEGRGILGELDDAGVVTFAIEAGQGSSVRGTEMFNRMMEHFGDKVVAIRGIWRKSPSGQPSTNIDKVNELTNQGMPLEDAVKYAWTVTRARKRGFDQVHVIGLTEGVPGAYTKIDVFIER